MKKWILFLMCAAMLANPVFAKETAPTHMAYFYGYPDGTIRPHEAVTREMLAEVFLRLTRAEAREDAFFDVPPTHWSYRAVCAVTELGIMKAERGYFRPTEPIHADDLAAVFDYFGASGFEESADEEITRAELAQMLNRLLDRCPQSADDLMFGMPMFSDNQDIDAWYYLDLQEASCTHTCAYTPNGERWLGLG